MQWIKSTNMNEENFHLLQAISKNQQFLLQQVDLPRLGMEKEFRHSMPTK